VPSFEFFKGSLILFHLLIFFLLNVIVDFRYRMLAFRGQRFSLLRSRNSLRGSSAVAPASTSVFEMRCASAQPKEVYSSSSCFSRRSLALSAPINIGKKSTLSFNTAYDLSGVCEESVTS
jgi:hypothetical protein